MITIKPKTFTDWSKMCKSYGYVIYALHFGTGGKRMDQCLNDEQYAQGIWNHTDSVGYMFAPEEKVSE